MLSISNRVSICIVSVVSIKSLFAVAKYLASTENFTPQLTAEFLTELRLYLHQTVHTYKQQSPVTASERGWIDRIILPHHWTSMPAMTLGEDLLLSEIWGRSDFGKSNE